ncbi:MAG TPA: hypothetical protein VND64_15110 [Pirellulales bacterium]|nr:hypothetical protein [Pirellulales bacterium]
MIAFNRSAKRLWSDLLLPSDAKRAAVVEDLRWLGLTRGNLQPDTTDREICHLALVHDETEDGLA